MQEESKIIESPEVEKPKVKLVTLDTKKRTLEEIHEECRLMSYDYLKFPDIDQVPETKPKEKAKRHYIKPVRYYDGFWESQVSTEPNSNMIYSWDNLSDYEDNLSVLLKKDNEPKTTTETIKQDAAPKRKLFDIVAEISKREKFVNINYNDNLLKLDFIPFDKVGDNEESENSECSCSCSSGSSSSSEIPIRVCFLCEKPGHTVHQCKEPFPRCHLCGNKGHIKRNCLLNSPNYGKIKETCRLCGKTGHLICEFNKYTDFIFDYKSDDNCSVSDSEDEFRGNFLN
jgi:hypothetical protein